MKRFSQSSLVAALLAASALTPLAAARAQTMPAASTGGADAASSTVDTIVVTGTRSSNRRALESASPVDVIGSGVIRNTGDTNLSTALTQISPSVNTLTFGEDLGALVSSIKLHGLSPDDTLVLIDGKRRHTSSYIFADPGPQQGSTAADLDLIPESAIDHIEILRDGAAAQYGSDAVAGVVNIILKSSAQGGSAQGLVGSYEKGDGFSTSAGTDFGTTIAGEGFLHVSADVRYQNYTDRSGPDVRYGAHVEHAFGSPESIRESLALNAERPINEAVTAYGYATYAHRDADGNEFHRDLPGVYPNGYSPIETIDEDDFAVTGGLKGDGFLGFHWDLSTTYGDDHINAGMNKSANVSLYEATGYTPTSFNLGSYDSSQWTNNIDLTRQLFIPGMAIPSSLSLGFEYRHEDYQIKAGEPDSYYGSGTSALPGLPPTSAGDHSREIFAGYGEWDIHPLKAWEVDLAVRGENYSDVGSTETGKLSTRYEIAPWLALRGTITNGFRAPSLAEEYFSNLGVSPSAASGQLAVNSTAARLLGAAPLKPERSTDVSIGLVAEPLPGLHVTLDAFQIEIRDRIVDGGTATGAAAVAALAQGGFSIPSTIDPSAVSAQFFTNGASTRTQGIDLTADYVTSLGDYGSISWDLGVDFTRTSIIRLADGPGGAPLLNVQDIAFLTTASSPTSKVTLAANWKLGKFDVTLRETRWGQIFDQLQFTAGPNAFSGSVFQPFTEKAEYTTNAEVGYAVTDKWKVAVGAQNLFNAYPAKIPADTVLLGVTVYDYSATNIGINGAFFYVRTVAKF